MSKQFVVLMTGYTGTGKSTLARDLSTLPDTVAFHSAVVRNELGILPRNEEEAEKFFSHSYPMKKEIDKKVYAALLDRTIGALKEGKNVIIDAAHLFRKQREGIYREIVPYNAEIFVIITTCSDEEVIKKRLKERATNFDKSPFNEAPTWDIYEASKRVFEHPKNDSLPEGSHIITYDLLSRGYESLLGDLSTANSEKIIGMLKAKFIIALDFDGVITSPYKLKTEYINQFGHNISEEGSGYDACVRKGDVSEEHYKEASLKALTESTDRLPLQDNFMDNYNSIVGLRDAAVYIVTSRYESMLDHLSKYLDHHDIFVNGIFHTSSENKATVLRKIKADLFVDDSPYQISQILKMDSKIADECSLVLFRTKANEIEDSPDNRVIEISGWSELASLIRKKYKQHFTSLRQ